MLIDKLEELRKKDGLTDAEFAEKLGISRPLWSRVRSGGLAPHRQFLAGVCQEYPELAGDVFANLIAG